MSFAQRILSQNGQFQRRLQMQSPIRMFSQKTKEPESQVTKQDDAAPLTASQEDDKKPALDDNWDKNPYSSYYNREKVSRKQVRDYLMPYIFHKDSNHLFYKSCFLLVGAKGLAVASPYMLKCIVDMMTVNPAALNFQYLAGGVTIFGVSRIFSNIFTEYRMQLITEFIQQGLKRISSQSFKHLHTLDTSFHKASSKNIVFGINRAIRSIEPGLRFVVGFFSPIAFEFTLLCGMLGFYCGPLYLSNMLVTIAIYTQFTRTYSKKRVVEIRERKNLDKKQEFYQNESIMNYDSVKAFGNEKLEIKRYDDILNNLQKQANIVQTSLSRLNIGQSIILSSGLTINLMMAAYGVHVGTLTPGDFVMIQALFMQMAGPLFNMGTFFREIDQAGVDMEDLFFMLKQQPVVKEKEDAAEFEYKTGQITFEKLGFKHYIPLTNSDKDERAKPDDFEQKLLFQNFDLNIQPGTTNAIVGQSGFGKTTLLSLLFRMYDPEEGRILIDGQDLKDLKFDSFRKYISIIPQNGILFNDTILFNLQYGNTEASLEEIQAVCKKCEIHDKIMSMQDGYETQVGDLGGKLSGGERQRVLIARGLLKKDARIFLFDEATSNLDGQTEAHISNELDNIMKGHTVIYCAHRLSSIMNVDKIHVLKDGCVVEHGTHNQLQAIPNSVYNEMWSNYLREVEETGSDVNEEIKEKVAA